MTYDPVDPLPPTQTSRRQKYGKLMLRPVHAIPVRRAVRNDRTDCTGVKDTSTIPEALFT